MYSIEHLLLEYFLLFNSIAQILQFDCNFNINGYIEYLLLS